MLLELLKVGSNNYRNRLLFLRRTYTVLKYLEVGQEVKALPQPLLGRVRRMHTETTDPNSEIFYLSQETYKKLLPVAESHNRSPG